MSRFDASDTVRMRLDRCVAVHSDAARVGVAEPVGQVLRKPQVDAVVDRHDRLARRQRRQHVVRRVEQVGALAPEVARDA